MPEEPSDVLFLFVGKNFVVSAFGVADGVGERRGVGVTRPCPTGILPG